MDHEVAHSDHMKLRVDEIAEKLSVTRRTVYSMIEREGWAKEEGIRGRVWYIVPVSFMEDYIRSSQEDQSGSQKNIHIVSQRDTEAAQQDQLSTVNNIEPFIEHLKTAHEGTLSAKDEIIAKLTEELSELKARLEASEVRANQAERMAARLEGEISRVDETLKAKDQAINAANAAVLIYEQHKTPPALEARQEAQEATKKGFWGQFFGK